jgi:hypothetical protein
MGQCSELRYPANKISLDQVFFWPNLNFFYMKHGFQVTFMGIVAPLPSHVLIYTQVFCAFFWGRKEYFIFLIMSEINENEMADFGNLEDFPNTNIILYWYLIFYIILYLNTIQPILFIWVIFITFYPITLITLVASLHSKENFI